MRIVIVAAAVASLAGSAAAATVRVPKDQPTVQAGVTAAASGDTVAVSKGVYFENVIVGTPGIRIVGKGAILDGNILGVDGDCMTINAAGVVVQGIAFRNGNDQLVVNADGVQVVKCAFQDADNDGIFGTGNNTVISSSSFYGYPNFGIELFGDGTTVGKCRFFRGGDTGIYLEGADNSVESCSFLGIDDGNCVEIVGDGAFVSRNRATFADSDCFLVTGNAAVVEFNKGDRNDGRVVSVNGNTAVVQGNSGAWCQGGIRVTGDGAQILSNRFANLGSNDGIFVDGDGFTVTGNSVATTWDDADGISANSGTGAGGGLIDGNKVSSTAGWGFNLDTIFNVTIRANSATRCGQDNRGGFAVVGDGNTLDLLKVMDVEGPGILVDGGSNVATACSVKKALTDGFRAANGAGNSFDRCSASACGGEGFDNRATGTVLTNGTFLKNRIDVANDVLGGATFTGGLGSVRFQTGDEATQPEVD